MKTTCLVLFATFALALAGCSTVSSRINQHAALFSELEANTQSLIRQGTVDIGFTPTMVYMALGNPDNKRERLTRDGTSETWIYNTYYQTYEGTRLVRYHRWYRYDPRLRRYHMYWGPTYADVYRTHRDERIRVELRNGEVVSINQAAR